jgi:pSer/pThr/pTyr-binding forkhead associated (FHA) protein
MGIVITVMSGVEDGKVFQVDKNTIMLGRHPEDDVCLSYDTKVSRHHARITKENASYFVEDIGPEGKGSTNGTYINDSEKKITGKAPLSSGDMVLLGGIWVKFKPK